MTTVRLGRTELVVNKQSFGCLPIQRITKEEAVALLRRAYDGGINYFDTARAYSDSEEKVGAAFAGMRDKIVISTKTQAVTAEGMWKDLEESLRALRTDYIDIYQFHNPAFCPIFALFSAIYDSSRNAVLNTAKIRRYIGIIHIPMPCCSFPNSIGMKVLPT